MALAKRRDREKRTYGVTRHDSSQLLGPQQEYSATAALKVQPYKRKVPERSPHRRFRITDLNDEKAAGAQEPPCFSNQDPHRIEAGISSRERDPWLMPVLRR